MNYSNETLHTLQNRLKAWKEILDTGKPAYQYEASKKIVPELEKRIEAIRGKSNERE